MNNGKAVLRRMVEATTAVLFVTVGLTWATSRLVHLLPLLIAIGTMAALVWAARAFHRHSDW